MILVSCVQRAKKHLARKKKCVSASKGWRMFFDFLSAKLEKNIEKNKESRVFLLLCYTILSIYIPLLNKNFPYERN